MAVVEQGRTVRERVVFGSGGHLGFIWSKWEQLGCVFFFVNGVEQHRDDCDVVTLVFTWCSWEQLGCAYLVLGS